MVGDEYFLEVGVPKDRLVECYKWAFGEDFYTIKVNELDDRWRQRHGDLFMIYDYDDARKAFNKIGKAFLESNNGKHSDNKN